MFTRVTGGQAPQTTPAARQPSAESAASFLPLRIQTKLTVGAVDDPLERQADQMAERVVSRSRGPLGISSIGNAVVQRCDEVNDDCSACEGLFGTKRGLDEDEDEEEAADEVLDELPQAADAEEDRPRKRVQLPGQVGYGAGGEDDEKILRAPATAAAPAAGTAAGAAGGAVPSGVESSIQQARNVGQALPGPVRERMEQSFGADFGRVRVHTDARADRLNRSLSARAFTTGSHIFFRQGENRPETPAGERLLAHELTHVVQQGGAPRQPGGIAPRFLAPANRAGAALAQRKFAGPQFKGGAKTNNAYGGHAFNSGGVKASTGCGIVNKITTAGEHKNNGNSDAGTPTDFFLYRKARGKKAVSYFSVSAGLLLDPSTARGCAVTKMHLINHRLENSHNTQDNAGNILLGTRISNNPTHLHEVENPVIDSLAHASRANVEYEQAMADAQETTDSVSGADVLFWKAADAPPVGVLTQAVSNVYLLGGNPANGVAAAAANKAKDIKGVALEVDANTADNNPRHLWLKYKVRANYGAVPQYVKDNIAREKLHNAARAKNHPLKKETGTRIDNFEKTWAPNAFPPDFTCTVNYYSATYEPGNIYRRETEQQNLDTDEV